MQPVTIDEIDDRLRLLPPEKLSVVYDFVSYLVERGSDREIPVPESEGRQTMLASEAVLRRDWDRPEEDEAWAHL